MIQLLYTNRQEMVQLLYTEQCPRLSDINPVSCWLRLGLLA